MLREALSRMQRCTKSAATAVDASRPGLVVRAARKSSPASFLSPCPEKCSSRTSSARASANRSSMRAWTW